METDRRKPSGRRKGGTVVIVPLGGALAGKLNQVEAWLGLTPVDLLRVQLGKLLHELDRNGRLELLPPMEGRAPK